MLAVTKQANAISYYHFRNITLYLKRCLSSNQNQFYITTPIFYVNSVPHIGHVYTALLADAQNRFQRLLGVNNTFLSTGTDEHGTKVYRAAAAANLSPNDFCDEISAQFEDVLRKMNVGFDVFVRTTSKQHRNAAQKFFKHLHNRGHIYSGEYSGWYCTSDEMFVPEIQVTEIKHPVTGMVKKISTKSGQEVEWLSEKNYLFKLSAFRDDLLYWLQNDGVVQPAKFQEILVNEIKEGLCDISVSRSRNRLPWGIPVPGDDSQTIYVWLDALVNYLTVRGYPDLITWPPNFHVLGKEILKFHGIYWPAFLIGSGMEPPRHLLVHSHWTVEHEKMSKSKGNVVNPFSRMKHYTPEGLRYYLLREGVPNTDGNYSDDKVKNYLNAELANTLGNILSRCTSVSLNPNSCFLQICPQTLTQYCQPDGSHLISSVRRLVPVVRKHYSDFNFYHGLEEIMAVLRQGNAFIQSQKPWEFKNDYKRLSTVIGIVMETLRVCGILLQPVIPILSSKLLDRLNISEKKRTWKEAECNFIDLEMDFNSKKEYKLGLLTAILFERVRDFEEVLKESVAGAKKSR